MHILDVAFRHILDVTFMRLLGVVFMHIINVVSLVKWFGQDHLVTYTMLQSGRHQYNCFMTELERAAVMPSFQTFCEQLKHIDKIPMSSNVITVNPESSFMM